MNPHSPFNHNSPFQTPPPSNSILSSPLSTSARIYSHPSTPATPLIHLSSPSNLGYNHVSMTSPMVQRMQPHSSEIRSHKIRSLREHMNKFIMFNNHESDLFIQEFRKTTDAWEILFDILLLEFGNEEIVQKNEEQFLVGHLLYLKTMYNFHQLNEYQIEWVRRYLLKSVVLFHNKYIQTSIFGYKKVVERLCLSLAMFTLNWILESEANLDEINLFSEIFKPFQENISLDYSGNFNSFVALEPSLLISPSSQTVQVNLTDCALDWFAYLLEQIETTTVFTLSQQAELKKEMRKMETRILEYISTVLTGSFPPNSGKELDLVLNLKRKSVKVLQDWVRFGISPEFVFKNDTLLQILFSLTERCDDLLSPCLECINELLHTTIYSSNIQILKKYIDAAIPMLGSKYEKYSKSIEEDFSMNICRDIIKLFMVFSEKINDWIINLDALEQAIKFNTMPIGGLLDPTAKNLIEVIIHLSSGSNISLIELTHPFWYHLNNTEIDFIKLSLTRPELKNVSEVVKSQLLQQLTSELIPYHKAIMDKTLTSAIDRSIQTIGIIEFDTDEADSFRDSSREVFIACYYSLRGQSIYVCEAKLCYLLQKESISNLQKGLDELAAHLSNNDLTEEFMDNVAKALINTLPDLALLESILFSMNSFGDMLKKKECEDYFSQLFSQIQFFSDIIAKISQTVSTLMTHPFHTQFTRSITNLVKHNCGACKNTPNILINLASYLLIPLFKAISKTLEVFSDKIVPLGEQPIIWCINFLMKSMSSFQQILNSKVYNNSNNVKSVIHSSVVSFNSLCEEGSKICKNDTSGRASELFFNLVKSIYEFKFLNQIEQSLSLQMYRGISYIVSALSSKQQEMFSLVFDTIFDSIVSLFTERETVLQYSQGNIEVLNSENCLTSSISLHFELRKLKTFLCSFDSSADKNLIPNILPHFERILNLTLRVLYLFVKFSPSSCTDVSQYLTYHWGTQVDQHLLCNHVTELWKTMITTVGGENPLVFPFLHKLLRVSCQFYCFGKVLDFEQIIDESQIAAYIQEKSMSDIVPTLEEITAQFHSSFLNSQPYHSILEIIGLVLSGMTTSPFPETFMIYFVPTFVLSYNITTSNIFDKRLEWVLKKKSTSEKFSSLLNNVFSDDENGDLLVALFRFLNFTWRLYPVTYLSNQLFYSLLESKITNLCTRYFDYGCEYGVLDRSSSVTVPVKSVSYYISVYLHGLLTEKISFEGEDAIPLQQLFTETISELFYSFVPHLIDRSILSDTPNLSTINKILYSFQCYNKMQLVACVSNYVVGSKLLNELVDRGYLTKMDITAFTQGVSRANVQTMIALRRVFTDFRERVATAKLSLEQEVPEPSTPKKKSSSNDVSTPLNIGSLF